MGRSCCLRLIGLCSVTQTNNPLKVSFLKVPSDPETERKFKLCLGWPLTDPFPPNARLCSTHFNPANLYLDAKGRQIRLHDHVLPEQIGEDAGHQHGQSETSTSSALHASCAATASTASHPTSTPEKQYQGQHLHAAAARLNFSPICLSTPAAGVGSNVEPAIDMDISSIDSAYQPSQTPPNTSGATSSPNTSSFVMKQRVTFAEANPPKYIPVAMECLLELLQRCSECGSILERVHVKKPKGAYFAVSTTCSRPGCNFTKWQSSPCRQKMPEVSQDNFIPFLWTKMTGRENSKRFERCANKNQKMMKHAWQYVKNSSASQF